MTDWTNETLLTHLTALITALDRRTEQRFQDGDKAVTAALVAQEKAVVAALAAAKEAVAKAESASEKWQKGANEWRGAMTDRERNFVQRIEYDEVRRSTEAKITDLAKRVERAEGSREGTDKQEGRGHVNRAYALATIGAAVGVIGFILNIVG